MLSLLYISLGKLRLQCRLRTEQRHSKFKSLSGPIATPTTTTPQMPHSIVESLWTISNIAGRSLGPEMAGSSLSTYCMAMSGNTACRVHLKAPPIKSEVRRTT